MIDLNRNWMFLEVARTGSFTAASKSTGIPKSTLSEKIQSLEDELGTTLMVRTTRSLTLTEAGEEYVQSIAASIDQLINARDELRQKRSKPSGKIRVSLLPSLANTHLTESLSEFLQHFPDISLELDFSERVVNLLEEGFDVCVRAGQPEDSLLLSKRIRRDRAILVSSARYLKRKGEPQSQNQCTEQSFGKQPSSDCASCCRRARYWLAALAALQRAHCRKANDPHSP